MKFLLLNQAFHPDVVSSGQHLADVAVALAQRGHEVTVISSRRAYDNPQQRFAKAERWHGVRILRVGSTGFGKDTKCGRFFDMVSFLGSCCLQLLFLRRHDVVLALSSPPLIAFLGLCFARARHSRFIYWIMDLNPDEALAAGWIRAGSVPARLLESLSRVVLRNADRLIVLDRFMFARVVSKGVDSRKIIVLPPWPHDSEVKFDLAGRDRFRRRFGLTEKFVVMYSGNHSPCHSLHTVLAAARALAPDREVVFCFIGGGTEFRRIQESIRATHRTTSQPGTGRNSVNILCLPYQPRSQLSASLSAADLHLVVMGDDFVGLVHPCKIYNILQVGSPVVYIGPVRSPTFEVLAQSMNRTSWACLAHGEVAGLIQQIQRFRAESRLARRLLSRSPDVRFSKSTILPHFLEQLETKGHAVPNRPLIHPHQKEAGCAKSECSGNRRGVPT